MIELTQYRDSAVAPSIYVNKIGGIYCLDTGLIKCTFALEAPGSGGVLECVERCSLLWPVVAWEESHDQFRWAIDEIHRGTFAPDNRQRRLNRN